MDGWGLNWKEKGISSDAMHVCEFECDGIDFCGLQYAVLEQISRRNGSGNQSRGNTSIERGLTPWQSWQFTRARRSLESRY